MEQEQHLVKQKEALSFVTGGNALFTIRLTESGKRYTYKVLQHYTIETKLKVSVLHGPDNTTNYKQFGEINIDNGVPIFKKWSIHEYAELFDTIFLNLSIGLETPGIEIFHFGRCCRCGRILTVPESIMSGIGPECAFKTSILKKMFQL